MKKLCNFFISYCKNARERRKLNLRKRLSFVMAMDREL